MKSKGIDLTNLTLVEDQYETLNDSECLFITNDWNEYRNPDLEILKTKLKKFVIFDGKDLLDYNLLKQKEDLKYFSIGRPDIS